MGPNKTYYQPTSREMAEPFPLHISKFKVKVSGKGTVIS